MVGDLLELHHDVEERRLSPGLSSEGFKIVGEDVLVELSLQRSQVGSHNELRLGRHALEHVGLHSAQHVRAEKLVKLVYLLLLGDVSEVCLDEKKRDVVTI